MIEITNADSVWKKTFAVYVIADSKERENMIREQIKGYRSRTRCSSSNRRRTFERSLERSNILPLWEVWHKIFGSQKKFWYQWKRTSITLLYVTLMVSSNDFISVRNGNALSTWKCYPRKWKKEVLVASWRWWIFWREDQNLRLKTSLSKWRTMARHEKIDSLSERAGACGCYCGASLAGQAGLAAEETAAVARAAEIYRVTSWRVWSVEFDGYQESWVKNTPFSLVKMLRFATNIREHYLPDSADGALPRLGWCHSCPCR